MPVQDPRKKKKQFGPPTELQWLQSVRGKALKSYQDTVRTATQNNAQRTSSGLVQWDDPKSIAPNIKQYQADVVAPLKQAIAAGNPSVINKQTYDLLHAGVAQKFLSPKDRDDLLEQIQTMRDKLSKKPIVFNENGKRTGLMFSPSGSGNDRRLATHGDLIVNQTYNKQDTKQGVSDFLYDRVDNRTAQIAKLDKYQPYTGDGNALGKTGTTAAATALGIVNNVVDPAGVSRGLLQLGADKFPALRPLQETIAPTIKQIDEYRNASDEGQADFNPRLEAGSYVEGLKGGLRSVVGGLYTGTSNAIYGPDVQGALRNEGLSAVDIMNEDAQRAARNPNSLFTYQLGQSIPALAMSLPLVGAQLNAARTLGQALLAPMGRASLGGAIGTGVGIAAPAAIGAATPFMPEPLAAATRQMLSPTDALWRAGIPEEASAAVAAGDPTGEIQRNASLAAGVLMMGGPSIAMWKDVKTTAERGMAYYKHQLGKGVMPRQALAKTLDTYGKSRIATSLGTEFAFGGGTPALHSIGQAVANVNKDRAQRPGEIEHFDAGHALSSTILGLLFQTRVPHMFQKSFEYNPLRKMEARSLARDYAVNAMKGPNKQVEKLRIWFRDNKGYEPNVEDIYRLTSAIKISNDEALHGLMQNADAPEVPRKQAYATLDEAIDAYINNDANFDTETRSQLDLLSGEVRNAETTGDEADFSDSALGKINIDDQLGYDAVARHQEIQRITDAVTPHFEQLLNSRGNTVKETESKYWGIKLNDGRTMVVSKRSGNRRIVTGDAIRDVDYIDPFAARPTTAHNAGVANALQYASSVIASMKEAYLHEIKDNEREHTGIPVGVLNDGTVVVVSKRRGLGRGGQMGFVRPDRAVATDPDIGTANPIREVVNWVRQNIPSYRTSGEAISFRADRPVSEEFPTKLQVGDAHIASRLVHLENGVGVYQTPDGGLFFIPGARGEVLPPIEATTRLSPADEVKQQLASSNLTAKSLGASLMVGGVSVQLRIPDLASLLGMRDPTTGAIDATRLAGLQGMFQNDPDSIVQQIWNTFAKRVATAQETALLNPVPDVGQIVTFDGESGQHIVVHSNKESGVFLARPLRNLNGETMIGMSYDSEQGYKPWVANSVMSREALERLHANASAIHGLTPEAMFPSDSIIDAEHLDMAAAMSNTGKVAGLLPTILNATPETLRQSILDVVDAANDLASHPDLVQYDIYKSLEYTLNEWMKANRGNADIVQSMMHDMYYQFSKQTVDSKKALAFWRLLRSDNLSETYNAIVMADSGAIATASDTTMNSALPGATNFPSLLSMAMRVNHLVFESGSTERRLETHIRNMVGKLGLEKEQEEDVYKKIRSLAYALRGVLPALQSKFLVLPSKQWLVHKFSGLPQEIQAFAYDMPIEPRGDNVDPVISNWHKSEAKYNEAVTHAEQQLAGPNAEAFRRSMIDNGYEYFVALAENATARSEQTAVRRALRHDVGAAKTWIARTDEFFRKRMVAQQTKAVVEAAVLLHSNRTTGTNYVVGLRQTQAALAHFDQSMVEGTLRDISPDGSLVRIGTRSIDVTMPSYDEIVSIISELQTKYSEHDLAHIAANDTDSLMNGSEMYVVEAPDGRDAAVAFESMQKARQVNATMQEYYDNIPLEDKQKLAVMLGPWDTVKRYLNQMVLSRPGEIADRDALEHIVYGLMRASENQAWSLKTLFTKAGDYDKFINAATIVREKMDLRERQNNVYSDEVTDGLTGRINLNFDTELDTAVKELVKVLRAEDPADRSNPEEFANLAGLSFVLMPEFLAQTPTLIRTKQGKELAARQLLREQEIIARNLKSDVQMSRQYKTDVLDVVNARQEINGRVSKFMGMDTALYDPNSHTLISDAMEVVLHGRQDRVLTSADIDAIVAEANRLQVAFARLDRDVESFAENPNAALTAPFSIEFDGDGSENYADADTLTKAKRITAYKVYTKAGLEALLLAAMKNELKLGEDVTLRDFVEARTTADEQLKTLYRTTTAVRDYLNRLVFQRGNSKILSAYYLPWESNVIDNVDLNAGALDGQVFFDAFVNAVERNLTAPQKTVFRQSITEYVNNNKSNDGTFKFEVSKLTQLINPFNIALQDVMPRSYDGNRVGAPFSTSDGMSIAYRITGRMAAMEVHAGVKFSRSENAIENKLRERLLGYKNTSVADTASQLDISSRPDFPGQLTANDLDLIIDDFQDLHTQLAKLKTSNQLHDDSVLDTVVDQLSYYRGLRQGHQGNDAISNLQTKVTDVVAQYKDATKLAKYVSEFHDMFATKSAINQLSYELNSSGTSLNEYVALGIAAKIRPDILRDAVSSNLTIGQLLGKEGIELGLTEVDQAKLKHLRIAQMKQDFYNSNHQLLITTADLLREQHNVAHMNRTGSEVYGQLKLLEMDRQNNAMSHLLFLASQKGPERTAFTIAHEMGHFIFESLPDYLQVQYLAAVIPDKGTYGQKQTTLQASHTAAYDLVNTAKAALHDWTEVQKNNPADFKLSDIEGWEGWVVKGDNIAESNRAYLKELSTVALTNFILSDGVVMDDTNRNTRSEHAIGVLQGYGQVLRNLHQRIANKAHDLITIDGKPYNGFFVDPNVNKFRYRANQLDFVSLRHGSNLHFIVPHLRGSTGSLLVRTPGDMMELSASVPDPTTSQFVQYMLGADSTAQEVQAAVDGGYSFMASSVQSGPFFRANAETEKFGYGRRVTGKVVGIVRATNFTTPQAAKEAGYNPAFMGINGNGKKVVWIHESNRENQNNKWYSTTTRSELQPGTDDGTASNARVGNVGRDYAYVVESTGSIKLFKRRTGENEIGYETKSWDNVTTRHLVGHDAFALDETQRPYIVETGKIGNPKFNHVVYSMLSRVDQRMRELGGDLNYATQVESQKALAREYSGKEDGFTDVYTDAVAADLAKSSGDIGEQLLNRDEKDIKAIQLARVGDWARLKAKAMSFTQWMTRNKGAVPESVNEKIKEATDSMSSFRNKQNPDGTYSRADDPELSDWYSGLKTKVSFGGKSFDGQTMALWLSQFAGENFQDTLGRIYEAWQDHANSGTEEPFDFNALGLNTEIMYGGRLFDMAPRLNEIFSDVTRDPDAVGSMLEEMYHGTMNEMWYRWLNDVMPSTDSAENGIPIVVEQLLKRGVPVVNTSLNPKVTFYGQEHDAQPVIDWAIDTYGHLDNAELNQVTKAARLDAPRPRIILNDSAPLQAVSKAALNWVRTTVFRGDDGSFAEYLRDFSGENGAFKQGQATNIFNAVRFVQNIDSRMRRNALRNWQSWNIHDTSGDSVILRAPDKQIGRRIYNDSKYGSLISVNLVTGETAYVSENIEYRADGTRKSYKPIKTFDQFLAYQNTHSDFRHQAAPNSKWVPVEDIFGNYAGNVLRYISEDPQYAATGKTYVTAPSKTWFRGSQHNDGGVMYQVTLKDGQFMARELSGWWHQPNDVEQKDFGTMLTSAIQHLPYEQRSAIMKNKILSEEYHIARLLLAKDKLTDQTHSQSLARTSTDKNVFGITEGKLQMRETSDNTWYSQDPTSHSVTPDQEVPYRWSGLEPPIGFDRNYDLAEAYYLARHADQTSAISQAASELPITLFNDPTLKAPIATTTQNGEFVVRINSKNWDEIVEPMNSLVPGAGRKKLAAKPGTSITINTPVSQTSAGKPFKNGILRMLGNDFRYILSNDLSAFAVQSFKAISGDPTLLFPALLALPSLVMPNWRDLPFFVGPLLEKLIHEKHGMSAGFGDKYYDVLMNKLLRRYNRIAMARDPSAEEITWEQLIKNGYQSNYKDWMTDFESRQALNPSRYQKLTDTSFVPVDENVNQGVLQELQPLFVGMGAWYSPMFWFPKRWDQTRLLMRDAMHLKHALDVMHSSHDLYEPNPDNEQADAYSRARQASNRRQAMRQVNLDFGLQKFTANDTQSPLAKNINAGFNYMQTAPAYHRNFLNSVPLLGEWSYVIRSKVNEIGNKIPSGATAIHGDVFDLTWEKTFYENSRTNAWARSRNNKRNLQQIVGMFGFSALAFMTGWLDHKFNERGIPFDGMDVLNPGSKKFGFIRTSNNYLLAIPPLQRMSRILKPIQAFTGSTEYTPKRALQAATDAAIKSYAASKFQNLYHIVGSAITGHEYMGEPSFEPSAGYLIAQKNGIYTPWTGGTQRFMPSQSNWAMNHMNLVLAQQAFEDYAKLGIIAAQDQQNYQARGLLGAFTESGVPVIDANEARAITNKTLIPRLLGFGIHYEPLNWRLVMKSKVNLGDSSTTLARLIWLAQHDWYDFPSASAIARDKGLNALLYGYKTNDVSSGALGIPTEATMNMSTVNPNMNIPMSKVQTELVEDEAPEPEIPEPTLMQRAYGPEEND